MKENGYVTPAEAHLSRNSKKYLTKDIVSNKIVLMRGRKKVEEKSILADDFIKRGSEKEEILACQFVTTS